MSLSSHVIDAIDDLQGQRQSIDFILQIAFLKNYQSQHLFLQDIWTDAIYMMHHKVFAYFLQLLHLVTPYVRVYLNYRRDHISLYTIIRLLLSTECFKESLDRWILDILYLMVSIFCTLCGIMHLKP